MNHQNNHDCKEILKKIFLVLDGEMSEEDEKVFLVKVTNCPQCLEVFSIEKKFKDFLMDKIEKKKVSPILIATIKEKINQIEIQ